MPIDSRKAFENIVSQYSEKLYWVIRRMVLSHDDTDDILQNVFLKAWKSWDKYRNESKVSTWLYRIAVNETIDFIRSKKRAVVVDGDVSDNKVSAMLMSDSYFDGDATQALLQEAVASLPDVQRQVFTLRYYDDMPYTEMSALLSTSEGALKASYHHAVKKIEKYFEEHD